MGMKGAPISERILTAAVLTVSDRSSRGERPDGAGPRLEKVLRTRGWDILHRRLIPDEISDIQSALREWSRGKVDLIVTTGGTGLGPRDVTPEATEALLEKKLPGLVEWMRREGRKKNHFAALSRAVAGVRQRTLIVNLPGNPSGAAESLALILPALRHARHTLHGGDHNQPRPAAQP